MCVCERDLSISAVFRRSVVAIVGRNDKRRYLALQTSRELNTVFSFPTSLLFFQPSASPSSSSSSLLLLLSPPSVSSSFFLTLSHIQFSAFCHALLYLFLLSSLSLIFLLLILSLHGLNLTSHWCLLTLFVSFGGFLRHEAKVLSAML